MKAPRVILPELTFCSKDGARYSTYYQTALGAAYAAAGTNGRADHRRFASRFGKNLSLVRVRKFRSLDCMTDVKPGPCLVSRG